MVHKRVYTIIVLLYVTSGQGGPFGFGPGPGMFGPGAFGPTFGGGVEFGPTFRGGMGFGPGGTFGGGELTIGPFGPTMDGPSGGITDFDQFRLGGGFGTSGI